MKIAGYCRTAQASAEAIEKQKRAITEWAAQKGHEVVQFYVDDGVSGITDNRKALTQLITDAEAGTFQIVAVYAPDRLARGPHLLRRICQTLQRYDVDVYSTVIDKKLVTSLPFSALFENKEG